MGKIKIKLSSVNYDQISKREAGNKKIHILFWVMLSLILLNWGRDIYVDHIRAQEKTSHDNLQE